MKYLKSVLFINTDLLSSLQKSNERHILNKSLNSKAQLSNYELKSKSQPGLEVIKLEFILRLKIKRSDWLLADTCPQAANHCALF